jgi:hypothetical protein
MTDEDLDTHLKRICDERGWSYPGARPLVERLFNTVAIREETIREVRGELTRFRLDMEDALGAYHNADQDVVRSARELVERFGETEPARAAAREGRWDELLKALHYRAADHPAYRAASNASEYLGRIWRAWSRK